MRILSYSHAYTGAGHNGGAETTLHDLMRMLRLRKHTTDALLSKPHPDGSGPYVLDGVKVQPFASKLDPELYFPRYDIIISHLGAAIRAGVLATQFGKPNIHLIHNDQEYCINAAARYASAMIFNTNWVVPKYQHCLNRPYAILHPPVEPKRYQVNSSREYITIINLTVGQTDRLSYDKGAHTFYEMARRFPNEKFLGVKGGYGDQYVPDELPPNVTIWEHTNNILEVYRRSKIVLTPSKYESYGRVAVEAGCSGIPAAVTETPGTLEAMGFSARYCQYGNFDEWEWAIQDILNNYDQFSWMSMKRAQSNWRRTIAEFDLIDDLILRLMREEKWLT